MPSAPHTTTEQVIDALRPVEDPELRRSIVELEMVREVRIEEGSVEVVVALTVAGCPLRNEIEARVTDAVTALGGVESVVLDFTVMSDDEREALRGRLQGTRELPEDGGGTPSIPFADPASRTRVLLISSGKGGVGKSSVTANLAIALAQRDQSVAIIDADVWGFSIPRMLGVDRPPVVIDDLMVPPEVHGVRCISIGFFAEEDQPIIWRGPMLHKALQQFLTDVFWDEPDFLVVDLPPGTGDIAISLAHFLPRAEVYVVTTPQPAAQRVAQRAAFMAGKVNLEVKGVIENMSWFTGDDGRRYEIFGSGGGQELADRLEVPLLGRIPLVPELREGSDAGRPLMAYAPESEAGHAFAEMAERVAVELAPTRIHSPGLKVV